MTGTNRTPMTNEQLARLESLRDDVHHNASVADRFQDWSGVFEEFDALIAELSRPVEPSDCHCEHGIDLDCAWCSTCGKGERAAMKSPAVSCEHEWTYTENKDIGWCVKCRAERT